MRIFLPIVFALLFVRCATSPTHFSKLHAGMEKADVLEVAGNPQRVSRVKGQDRWVYIVYDGKVPMEHTVIFVGGKMIGMLRADQEKKLEDELESQKAP